MHIGSVYIDSEISNKRLDVRQDREPAYRLGASPFESDQQITFTLRFNKVMSDLDGSTYAGPSRHDSPSGKVVKRTRQTREFPSTK
jgi:hypothetical protein